MIAEWVALVAIVSPIAGLILALDAKAGGYRKDVRAKLDELRAYTEQHHRGTMEAINKIDVRLAVVEDRSKRVRAGDGK